MVLGIVSLVFLLLAIPAPPLAFISLTTTLIGLVLSLVGGAQDNRVGASNGMATAGTICSGVALLFFLISLAVWASQ